VPDCANRRKPESAATVVVEGVALTARSTQPVEDLHRELPGPGRTESLLRGHVDEDRLYAAVVRSVSDAIITKTLDGTITGWNRAAERLFGYTSAEAIGQSIKIIMPPGHDDELTDMLDGISRGEHIDHFETLRYGRDGRVMEVSLSISPVRSQSGEIIGAAKIVRDISDQKFAERKFELAVEACPSGILMIDPAGAIVLVNAELERQFGYNRSELIGKCVDMLLPEQLSQVHAKHRAFFYATPAVRAMGSGRDLKGRRKDGSEFSVEIGLNPINAREGSLVLATVIDITARKEAERAVELQNEQLRQSNAELEQFAYVASHDLQEPLRMVASFTELLQERYGDRLDDKGHKYIGYAVEGAKRMQSLVRDLLAYSRVTATEKVLKPVDSAAIVAAAIERLSPSIREGGTEMSVGPLPVVMGDDIELGQVFQNLISNAVKFRSDRAPRIEIAAQRDGGAWTFSVADNGIGIDAKFSERIFQMFQRLHERGRYDGSGIGLAIAKKIVERHHGTIWFTSALNQGTTFYLTLPAADHGS
jgi:PAS domain S-box-containing protein